jgi:hypothetical protein
MKRLLMLVGVAVVVGAMYVAAAPGSRQATGPTARQFAALKKRVAGLSKKLKVLTKDETNVKKLAVEVGGFVVACYLSDTAGFKGVTRYGDAASSTYGFVYQPTAGVSTTGVRTALDFDTSAAPQVYLQAVDPTCATSSGAAAASAETKAGGIRLQLRTARAH